MPKNANKAKIAAKNFDRITEFLLSKKKKKKSKYFNDFKNRNFFVF